jgi:bifunctional oligoribonuclease and PAP phosphatase NrnA
MTIQWSEATQAVHAASTVLLVTHIKPDGDAIGSMVGLAEALRTLGKTVTAAVDGGVPDYLGFIPGTSTVLDQLDQGQWDLLISVDASDEERSGAVGAYGRAHSIQVVNLDHHPTNTGFGHIHLINASAVSATEIVFDWLQFMQLSIHQSIATALLTGLVTDTMGFRTSNVVPRTMEVAQQLMLHGASLMEVLNRTIVSKPFSHLLLWREALPSLTFEKGIASVSISTEALKRAELRDMTDGGLVSILASAEEVMIAAAFKEQPDNKVEISFRSKPGYDVGSVALSLGGGGHTQASGVTVAGTLESVREQVMPLLRLAYQKANSTASS